MTGQELALPTQGTVDEWALPSRQQLQRSHAFELLGNDATDQEVREALTNEVRAALPVALAGWEVEARRPSADFELADLMGQLGRYIALTGTSLGHDDRVEWIQVATDELAVLPMSLVLPAIADARRRVPWPNKLVSTIFERVEDKAARLDAEGEKLRRLTELA